MYRVVLVREAQRVLDRLSAREGARVLAAIEALASNPRPAGCIKLSNSEQWRIRVGDYRVIYEIAERALIVTVVRVGHRREVYR